MNDKQNRKTLEELSAYLDGEAANPAEVERRIDAEPETARMAKELTVLSDALGRLPVPDVHPAFRTRVMAHVRETEREAAPSRFSWRWRAFAAMVVLVPFGAAIWLFWLSPPAIPEADGQRVLVRYLLEQDEDVVLTELAELFVNELDSADSPWLANSGDDRLASVDDAEWLDVLAMDSAFAAWDDALDSTIPDSGSETFSDDELREIERLLIDEATGDSTI